ncbi:IclR family transcriptional regulator [Yaniella flava]|uniref:IclR family transcriptional regulator n=1 Tax=Yaniella flava TaxID=287930 RepID=A0ABN2U9B0_9MICC
MKHPSGETLLDRILRILSAFDARRRQLSVAELSRLADIPLATTYRLVTQLSTEDILTRYPDGTVGLGMRLWELVARSSPAVSLRTAAMPFLDDVQAIFRQHTQLSVLDNHEVLVVERLSSRNSVVNQATVATRMPLHTVSMGLAQLAFQPGYIVEEYFTTHPEVADMNYPTTGDIHTTLTKIRREGYAMLDGMLDDGTTGAAVPVFNTLTGRNRVAIAAISVVVPEDFEQRSAVIPVLMAASRGLSRALHPLPEPT